MDKIAKDNLLYFSSAKLEELYPIFDIDEHGYNESKVNNSKKKYGNNHMTSQHEDTIIHCIKRAFINPFSIILFIIGVIALFTDVFITNIYTNKFNSAIIIFLMVFISGIIRLSQELRAKKIADDLTTLVQTSVQVLRDDVWVELSSNDIVVGDTIKIEAGEQVPADIRLIDVSELFVSQSTITGESSIVEKSCELLVEKPIQYSDYTNILFAGTTVTGGQGRGIVIGVGNNTVYGGLNIKTQNRSLGFDKGANSIAWVMIRFMAILVPIVFISSGLTQDDWLEAFLFSLSVAVGLTPELLPMVVNACLAKGSYSMGKKQTIVKNINAMQSFGSMDVLCVDKTGTLTGDQVLLEYYMDILGNESQKTLDYAYLASYYHTGINNHIEKAIRQVNQYPGQDIYYENLVNSYKKVSERPFDYGRRFSSVIVQNEDEQLYIIKGSIDEVISQCQYIEYAGNINEIGNEAGANVSAVVDEMLEDGMKVIAIAYQKLDENLPINEKQFILLGYLAFFDAPKKSAKSAISKLRDLNVNIRVLSGDQMLVTKSICKRLQIETSQAITGSELEMISENDLPMIVEKTKVFAGLSPKQKEKIVEILQSNGHTVGFLGDGMNDLPAILQADVGISVENAAEAVKESANVILLKKDLNILEEGILEGRKAFANMTKYIKITASSNFGNICAIVIAGILLPFFPMTSVQLLLLNLLYDILCLILPWDKVDQELFEKPLEWSGRTLGGFMRFFGPVSSIFDIVTYAMLYFVICPYVCKGNFMALNEVGQATFMAIFQTGWFLESMWTQVLILQLLRTEKIPFVQSKPGKPVIYATVFGIIAYSILPYTLFGQALGLCPMPSIYFLFLIFVVSLYLLLVSAAKSIYIKKKGRLI